MLKFQVRKRQNDASPSPTRVHTVESATERSFYDNCALVGGEDYVDRNSERGGIHLGTGHAHDSGSCTQSLTSAESALSLWSSSSSSSAAVREIPVNFVRSDYHGDRRNSALKFHRTVISLNDNGMSRTLGRPNTLHYGTMAVPETPCDDNTENVAPPLSITTICSHAILPSPPVPLRANHMASCQLVTSNKSSRNTPARQIFTDKLLKFETQKPQRLTLVTPMPSPSLPPPSFNSPTIPDVSLIASTPPSTSTQNELVENVAPDSPFAHMSSRSSTHANGEKHSLAPAIGYSVTNGGRIRTSSLLSGYHRSNSLGSLSSLDSGESISDWNYLRVFTGAVRAETDYVTLKIAAQTTANEVVARLLVKFRLISRDSNLFQLWMEVRMRAYDGSDTTNVLKLDRHTRPLELQRCYPPERSRFVLAMVTDAVLVRIFDGEVCPQSNYKSVLISRRTSCIEALRLVLRMCRMLPSSRSDFEDIMAVTGTPLCPVRRDSATSAASTVMPVSEKNDDDQCFLSEYGLFIELTDALPMDDSGVATVHGEQVPADCALVDVYLQLASRQRIALRRLR